LDFDGVPAAQVLECAKRFQDDGIALLWHTSWSHGLPGKGECRRIIIPLAEPVPGAQYDALLGMVWGRYAEHADRASGGAHRAFYVPSVGQGREAELEYLPGEGLKFSALTPPLAPVPEKTHSISAAVWTKLAARWARSTRPSDLDLADRLRKILEGLSYAAHGERDTVTWRLVQAIAHAYPDVSRESVQDLFSLSIDRMRAEGSTLTLEELAEKLDRARRAEFAKRDTILPDDRRSSIRQAFGTTRDTPYTDDEIVEIQGVVGLSREELDHSWILHRSGEYWIVGPGGTLATSTRESLENVARVVLSPAPIELHEIGKTGRQWMTRRTLLEKYSLPLEEVARSLVLSDPRFDLPNRRLVMPSCPRRAIAPRLDPEIDRWLRLLAGSHYDALCAWLQWVPDLTRPIAALILTGDPSIGKTLLAQGVSRLWSTTGPTDLHDALGTYDQAIESCPYCFADEGRIPRDWRGKERTEDLREFVQCTRRTVNQKYRQPVALEGATRTQIAANNLNVLSLGGNLSGQDVDAIAARFLHIPGRIEAARFLEARGGRAGAEPWVEGDGIAAHVLHLAQHPRYPWIGRFGVSTQPDLVDRMLVRGGVRAALCECFVRALKDDQPLRDGACVSGMFACRLDWIGEVWDVYMRRAQKPETPALLQALDGLGQRIESDGEGWFAIETSRLVTWAREAGVGTPELVHGWLRKHEGRE
jgi:hypothetical protein